MRVCMIYCPRSPRGGLRLTFSNGLNLSACQPIRTLSVTYSYLYLALASNSIDGSCLELISEVDLEEEIYIKSNIHKKKIMNCKGNGLYLTTFRGQAWTEGLSCR